MQPTLQNNAHTSIAFFPHHYRLLLTLLLFAQTIVLNTNGQMRQLYLDAVQADNEIKKMSFYSPSQGYVAFTNWIGYTSDSGRNFTRKYITISNVDYNGYPVNLTFGFGISGVKAFGTDTLLAYGHYGFVPSILYSTDQGNSFRLIYQSQVNAQQLTTGVTDMVFPDNTNIGYAVEADRIIKTTNRGKSWFPVYSGNNSFFDHIEAVDDNILFAFSNTYANKLVKSYDGGSTWLMAPLPLGQIKYVHFMNGAKGWVNLNNNGSGLLYYTSTGGVSWTLENDPNVTPFFSEKIKFINDSTGYALDGLFSIYKTTDSGKVWEPLPRDNNYTYLGYGHNDWQFWNNDQFWAGGGHGFLEITTNGGGTPLPKAFFRIDTNNVSVTKQVNLINYSKPGYQYQWFKNDIPFSTSYNASYTHDLYKEADTIKLVVAKGTYTDTAIQVQYFIVPPPPPIPVISAFTPISAAPGTAVTITGSNFIGTSAVSFGGVAASSFTIVSATEIRANVGAGASGDVTVTNAYGTGNLSGFTYLPPPSITSFTPTSGDAGTVITITGSNFTNITNVSFGGATATSFTVISPITITAVVGSAASGNVAVTNAYGTGTLAGFVFTPHPPIITSFSPIAAPANTTVTITGNNFNSNAVDNIVYFGAAKATVTAATTASLNVIVPAGATYAPITVTTKNLTAFSLKPFIVTFTGDTAINSGSFAAKTDFTSGGSPMFTNVADVDGDGKDDISVSNFNSNTVSILRNTGSNGIIAFAAPSIQPVGSYVRGHTYGDFDGDGKKDIAVFNYYGSSVSVSKNTSIPGAISFGAKQDFTTRGYPWDAVVNDMDGDGKADLIIAIEGNGEDLTFQLSVLRNTSTGGTISFAPKQDFVSGGVPDKVCVADIDGDGKPDIITGNGGLWNQVSVLRNTSTIGNISFATKQDFTVGTNASEITVGDLDGDGLPEIIAGIYQIAVLRNTSTSGNVSFAPIASFPTQTTMRGMSLCDLNGDARPEIIVSNETTQTVSVFKNLCTPGNIAFASKIDYGTSATPYDPRAGDFDGDGKPDIAVACVGSAKVSVLRNTISDAVMVQVCQPTITASLISNITGSAYQWQQNTGSGFVDITDNTDFSGTHTTTLQLSNIALPWNGYLYRCVVDGNNSQLFQLSVKGTVTPAVSISASDTTICSGISVMFTAAPVNGGIAPAYQWQVNGINVGTNSPTYSTVTLKDGASVKVVMTSDAACVTPATATSDSIQMTVMSYVTPSVNITASATSICAGTPVTFMVTTVTNGGTAPAYRWKKNGSYINGATGTTYIDNTLKDNDGITVELTSNASCITQKRVTSNNIRVAVNSVTTPVVTISSPATTICSGEAVTFTATATNGGTTPSYQWQVNGVNTGINNAVFTTNTLTNGAQVQVILTSNLTCAAPNKDTSNKIAMQVNQKVTPSINISGNTTVTKGQSTTISSTVINAGTAPTYQWQDSTKTYTWTSIAGATTASVVYTAAATGDKIHCVVTSNSACVSQTTATSEPLVFTVNDAMTPVDTTLTTSSVRLYPNPATSTLILDSLKLSDKWKTLEISNMNGDRLITQNIQNQTKVIVWVAQLSKGLFIVVLRRENGDTEYLKFLKM